MHPDLGVRQPGDSLPTAVQAAAVRAGKKRRPPDPHLLDRVRDALARLPDEAQHPHYFEVPPRPWQSR
jgi:hypothetical protein